MEREQRVQQQAPQQREKRFRSDSILAAFVVAIATSFLTALAMLLLKAVQIPALRLDMRLFADVTISLLILFFLSIFVLIKGSTFAAWLLYRREIGWGEKTLKRNIIPIFIISLIMSFAIFSAVYAYGTGEIDKFAYLQSAAQFLERPSTL